jgi:hypothetical protein
MAQQAFFEKGPLSALPNVPNRIVIPTEAEGPAVHIPPRKAQWTRRPSLCHPDRSVPGFPATLHWTGPRVRLSVRERRMKSTNATKFHRNPGERSGGICSSADLSWKRLSSRESWRIQSGGIPHLAKDERDVGHPDFRCVQIYGQGSRQKAHPTSAAAGKNFH